MTNLNLSDHGIKIHYFNLNLKIIPPLLSHAAFLTFYSYLNQSTKPHQLSSLDFDLEFIRLTKCLNPQISNGCSSLLFKNKFKGAWEGFFCYFDFDHYRDMLSGTFFLNLLQFLLNFP